MKFDSVQITKMQNGFLVSCMRHANAFTKTPPSQEDFVFHDFKQVLELIGDKTNATLINS